MGKKCILLFLLCLEIGRVDAQSLPTECSSKPLPGTLNEVEKVLNGTILDEKKQSCVFNNHSYDGTAPNDLSKFDLTYDQIKNELSKLNDDACKDPAQKVLDTAKMICENEYVGERSIELVSGRINKHVNNFKKQFDESNLQVKKSLEDLSKRFAKEHSCLNGAKIEKMETASSGVKQSKGQKNNLEELLEAYKLQLNESEERVGVNFTEAEKQQALASYEKNLKEKISETQKSLAQANDQKSESLTALYASALVQNQDLANRFGYICSPPVYKPTLAVAVKNRVIPDVPIKLEFEDNSNEIDAAIAEKLSDKILNDNKVTRNLDGCKRTVTSVDVIGSSSRLRNTGNKNCPDFDFVCLSQRRADQFSDAVLAKAFPGLSKSKINSRVISTDGTSGEECPYRAANPNDLESKYVVLKEEYRDRDSAKRRELDKNRFVKVMLHFSGSCQAEKIAAVPHDSYLSQCKMPIFSCR